MVEVQSSESSIRIDRKHNSNSNPLRYNFDPIGLCISTRTGFTRSLALFVPKLVILPNFWRIKFFRPKKPFLNNKKGFT